MSRRKRIFWVAATMAGVLVLAAAAEACLLRHPEPLFPWSVRLDGLALYSDTPFAESEGLAVLSEVQRKLTAAELGGGPRADAAFVCNSRWRRLIFCVGNYRAGGLNYAPLTTNVFLSGGDVARNRLIAPNGNRVNDERTLAYFIAHEVTHSLTQEHTGLIAYWRLPLWMREGYADYVARGSVFGRVDAREAYRREAPEMNWPAQAPYLRFNLLLGFLLEHEQVALAELFAQRIPRADAEARLRRFLAGSGAAS